MTETIYTLSLHACAEGDILPLAFLPATAEPVHTPETPETPDAPLPGASHTRGE